MVIVSPFSVKSCIDLDTSVALFSDYDLIAISIVKVLKSYIIEMEFNFFLTFDIDICATAELHYVLGEFLNS